MSRLGTCATTLVVSALLLGCSDDSGGDEGGGGTGGTPEPTAVTFTEDIHPVLLAKCGGSGCHDGNNTPVLPGHGAADVQEAYDATQATSSSYGGPIYDRILLRMSTTEFGMMPPNFANPPCNGTIGSTGCATRAEIDLIAEWIEQGTPL